MIWYRALVLGVGTAATALYSWSATASATPGYGSATLPTQIEAWYWTAGCSSEVGCGTVVPPSDPYPANTLHVGDSASQPFEATYFTLNTAAVPTGSVITQATLNLPVATDGPAATVNAPSAQITVCPTTESFPSADFATYEPPSTNCNVSTPAIYKPGSSEPYFTVNLAPILKASGGTLTGVGIAVLPAPTQTASTWQVTFNGRQRKVPGQAPITAQVTYQPAPGGSAHAAPTGPRSTATPASSPAASNFPAPLTGPSPPAATSAAPASAPSAAPTAPAAAAAASVSTTPFTPGPAPSAAAQRVAVIHGGQYGMVWAVPLGLLALAWLIVTTATRDLRAYLPGAGRARFDGP